MGIWSAQQARKASSGESRWYKHLREKKKQKVFLLIYESIIHDADQSIKEKAKLGDSDWSCQVHFTYEYNMVIETRLINMVKHDRDTAINLAVNSAVRELKRLGYRAEIDERKTIHINWKED